MGKRNWDETPMSHFYCLNLLRHPSTFADLLELSATSRALHAEIRPINLTRSHTRNKSTAHHKNHRKICASVLVHGHLLVCLFHSFFLSCCQTLQNGDSSNAYSVHGQLHTDTPATTNESQQRAVFADNWGAEGGLSTTGKGNIYRRHICMYSMYACVCVSNKTQSEFSLRECHWLLEPVDSKVLTESATFKPGFKPLMGPRKGSEGVCGKLCL